MVLDSELYSKPRIRYFSVSDSSFVSGDSPVTHDVFSVIKKNAIDGYITCDGEGDVLVSISTDGTTYGLSITLKQYERLSIKNLSVYSVKVTHSGADSAYRIFAI